MNLIYYDENVTHTYNEELCTVKNNIKHKTLRGQRIRKRKDITNKILTLEYFLT